MSRRTFEQLRLPLALVLVLVAAIVFFPRGNDADPASGSALDPTPSVIVGEPVGEALPQESTLAPSPSPLPADTPAASPAPDEASATPESTTAPADGFTAEVLICRSNSGTTCNGEMREVPPSVDRITALVLFTDVNAGDELRAVADGPGGTRDGGSYRFQTGGDGHYFTTFTQLEPGDYTVTAFRNGEEVASTSFRRLGN